MEPSPPRCPAVVPRDPGGDPAHDLVADGVQALGPLLGADAIVALSAQEHDLVANRNLIVTAVHHELVHGDHTHDAATTPADQHLPACRRQPSGHTVGIADG